MKRAWGQHCCLCPQHSPSEQHMLTMISKDVCWAVSKAVASLSSSLPLWTQPNSCVSQHPNKTMTFSTVISHLEFSCSSQRSSLTLLMHLNVQLHISELGRGDSLLQKVFFWRKNLLHLPPNDLDLPFSSSWLHILQMTTWFKPQRSIKRELENISTISGLWRWLSCEGQLCLAGPQTNCAECVPDVPLALNMIVYPHCQSGFALPDDSYCLFTWHQQEPSKSKSGSSSCINTCTSHISQF